ncbi:MAG TPA: hypothetical protein VFB55_01190 [Verrucomicrobiae bacterium]|nr:hypothetical protein [Verrucomicrobiae bacterium]
MATPKPEKAAAFYAPGVFHDNNSREALAIPNYQKAIRPGLAGNIKRWRAHGSRQPFQNRKTETGVKRMRTPIGISRR